MKPKDVLGHRGEDLAAEYLSERGYRIVERNWRCPLGEIDVVAEHAGVTVFVEVKTRSGLRYGHPFEGVTVAKLNRLKKLTYAWCEAHGGPGLGGGHGGGGTAGSGDAGGSNAGAAPGSGTGRPRARRQIRIDVVGVIAAPREPVVIEHLEGVF